MLQAAHYVNTDVYNKFNVDRQNTDRYIICSLLLAVAEVLLHGFSKVPGSVIFR